MTRRFVIHDQSAYHSLVSVANQAHEREAVEDADRARSFLLRSPESTRVATVRPSFTRSSFNLSPHVG